jgi:hypothetical protein
MPPPQTSWCRQAPSRSIVSRLATIPVLCLSGSVNEQDREGEAEVDRGIGEQRGTTGAAVMRCRPDHVLSSQISRDPRLRSAAGELAQFVMRQRAG